MSLFRRRPTRRETELQDEIEYLHDKALRMAEAMEDHRAELNFLNDRINEYAREHSIAEVANLSRSTTREGSRMTCRTCRQTWPCRPFEWATQARFSPVSIHGSRTTKK